MNVKQHNLPLLKKLSLFSLTTNQIKRIISQQDDPFRKRLPLNQIVDNPYLLCEEYVAKKLEKSELDAPEITDSPIGIFKIDIGMFPDSSYLTRNRNFQNLSATSPERLRAIIIDYLKRVGQDGDCYANVEDIYDWLMNYPLFYKHEVTLDKEALHKNELYVRHFKDRLKIIPNKSEIFFYLNEVHAAEKLVRDTILELINRADYNMQVSALDDFIEQERKELEQKIPNFLGEQFTEERARLLSNSLKKSFYIISGKPGSGKTQVLKKIIEELSNSGEYVTILAPTGKATLRLNNATGRNDAQTIDRFIYSNNYEDILEDFQNLIIPTERMKPLIQNLIIDESSMVDLQRFAALFSMIELKGSDAVKRVILVGDENQLPPIGYGKPFYDIIEFIKSDQNYRGMYYIQLQANCRQQFDDNIIKIAELFAGKNRYYEELMEKLDSGQYSSAGFSVELWKDRNDLFAKIVSKLSSIIDTELTEDGITVPSGKPEALNLMFGLYDSGHVRSNDAKGMKLDRLQLLSPYRAGYFGTLGLNDIVKSNYRKPHPLDSSIWPQIPFTHSEKIIRITNYYNYNSNSKKVELLLSNGSIGIVCNKINKNQNTYNKGRKNRRRGKYYHQYFFPDAFAPIWTIDGDENFEMAYAITVHKSQGSEFKNIFIVIPSKQTLLTKELLYTALTRSTKRVTLFLQQSQNGSTLEETRKRSSILPRMTSIFEEPENFKRIYEPQKGRPVKSKIEYIIYKYLEQSGLKFVYEDELQFKKDGKVITIHPDFTIHIGNKLYFWEHLGELDMKKYSTDWSQRKKLYATNGLSDNLITTDDLNGVKHELITMLIENIKTGNLQNTPDNRFSEHHYKLY